MFISRPVIWSVILLSMTALAYPWGNPRGRRRIYFWCEDYYKFYTRSLHRHYSDPTRNIFYLEWALKSPFRPYEKALVTIQNNREWQRYKKLLTMHIYFLLTESYIHKANAHFKPFRSWFDTQECEDLKKELNYAQYDYKIALHYWGKTVHLAGELAETPGVLDRMQRPETLKKRIHEGKVYYRKHILRYRDKVADEIEKAEKRIANLKAVKDQYYPNW